MKKMRYAMIGVCLCLAAIYMVRMNPRYQMDPSVDGSRPVVIFVEDIVTVGSPLSVVTAGYPKGTVFHYTWQIGNEIIDNEGNRYIPTEDDLQKFIAVTVTTEDGTYEPQTIRIYFSDLPVCYLETENGVPVTSKEEYISATLTIQGNEKYSDEDQLYQGAIQIKGRGNTTWRNTNKKPYHIKLEQDANLFGMGAENDWMMLSNPFDQTLMRNALAFDLSGKLGLYQIQYTWVDVVLNGQYVGNYQICEKIEVSESRIDIVDWEALASEVAKVLIKTGAVQEKDSASQYPGCQGGSHRTKEEIRDDSKVCQSIQ